MTPMEFLKNVKEILVENNILSSDLEMTSGNCKDSGEEIREQIPTITTSLCEIGIFDDALYLVVILHSNMLTRKTFDTLESFKNIQLYGFKDFKKTLYPIPDFDYTMFEKELLKDKYTQVQFTFPFHELTPKSLFEEYVKIQRVFLEQNLNVVNQIKGI